MLNEHLLFPAVLGGSKQVMDKGLCLAVGAHQQSMGKMITLKIQIAQLFVVSCGSNSIYLSTYFSLEGLPGTASFSSDCFYR